MSLDVKVDRFLRGVDAPLAIQSATWLGSFSLPAVRELMPDFRSELTPQTALGDVLDAFHRREGDSDVRRMLDFFKRFYLPNDILRKVDRASMWVGLEVRCPLLDTSLASLVAGFPDDWLLRGSQTKWILKRALRRGVDGRALVLPAILNRPKKGFGIPIARWLRTDLAGDVEEHLIRNWPASLEFLDREAVRSLAQEHLSRLRNAAKEVWSLLILARWVRIHDVK
jgi:asparagine synthase (glutamine-hydrolysing)